MTVKSLQQHEKGHIKSILLMSIPIIAENLLQALLYAFPMTELRVHFPRWMDALEAEHPIKQQLYRALLERAAETLKDQGVSGILLVPGEPGLFGMYRKLGFADTLYVDEFSVEAAGGPVPVRQLSAEEYGYLRRAFLF